MKNRGYALPLSLCVAGVTLMLGLCAASMTNGDLSLANHQYYQERARQAADFGLEYCVSHQVPPGSILPVASLSNAHPHDNVTIQVFQTDTPGAPVNVPPGFEYWVAEGHASENQSGPPLASARVGAMVRYGLPAGTAGAQIRSLSVQAGNDAVDFVVRDGLTGQPVANESVVSSDYDGGNAPLPFPGGGQSYILDLGKVASFKGNFRLPKGTDKTVVHQRGTTPINVSQDGGPTNIPTFSPPAGLTYISAYSVPDNFSGTLPSGHYGQLIIPPSAVVHLKGTYHFESLKLADSTPAGRGGLLKVDSDSSAKVYIDKIDLGAGSLGLTNQHGSAQNFRITLQPVRTSNLEPVLNFKLPEGGGVSLFAEGHRIALEADSSSREIRGAFAAAALETKYPPADSGNGASPIFIYDVSATTARRSNALGRPAIIPGGIDPGSGTVDSPAPGNAGNPGNIASAGDGGNNNQVTDVTGKHPSGDNPRVNPPVGLEPMILSRQSL
jgi:hypothetical protein